MTPRPANRKIVGRALVTGGAIRVGRAIALALADAGFDVAIAFHRSAAEARRTVEELRRRGVKAIAIRADLRDARAARTLVAEAARAGCGLDVLVNSAALFEKTPLASATRARWDELIALNLRAAFFCTQAAAARMIDGGHVVNVSDVITRAPRPGWAAYTASKAGEVALRITRGDGPTDYVNLGAARGCTRRSTRHGSSDPRCLAASPRMRSHWWRWSHRSRHTRRPRRGRDEQSAIVGLVIRPS
jgi:hypothetical protein